MKKNTFATFENNNTSSMFENIESNNAELHDNGRREYLPVNKLLSNPNNAEMFTLSNIEEFADSMKENGFEGSHLIGVYDLHNGYYEIYSGHRRVLSAKKAGIEQVPCYIKEEPSDEKDKMKDLIGANLNARTLTPLEWAKMIEKYRDVVLKGEKDKRTKMSDFFKISGAQVSRYESILKLIPSLQEYAVRYGVPYSALVNAGVLSEEKQIQLKEQLDLYFSESDDDMETATISKARLLSMIEELKNDVPKKKESKNSKSSKSSDKKIISSVKSLETLAKKQSLTIDNPEDVLAELRKIEKIVNSLKLKVEDCMQ